MGWLPCAGPALLSLIPRLLHLGACVPRSAPLDSHWPVVPQEPASPGHSQASFLRRCHTSTPANPQCPAVSSSTGPQGAQTVAVTAGPWRGRRTPWLPLGVEMSLAGPGVLCRALSCLLTLHRLPIGPFASIPFSWLMALLPLICVREHLDQAPPYGA